MICCDWIWINTLHFSFLTCRYLEYKARGSHMQADRTQPTISSFSQKVQLYAQHSPRYLAITDVILHDLVIGCCLPLSLVENPHFRDFLQVLDCKYTPVSRRTLTEKLIPGYKLKQTSSKSWRLSQVWQLQRTSGLIGGFVHSQELLLTSAWKTQRVYTLCSLFCWTADISLVSIVEKELLQPLRKL